MYPSTTCTQVFSKTHDTSDNGKMDGEAGTGVYKRTTLSISALIFERTLQASPAAI